MKFDITKNRAVFSCVVFLKRSDIYSMCRFLNLISKIKSDV